MGDARNPYLDNSQRMANFSARTAVQAGMVVAGTAAVAAATALGVPASAAALASVGVGAGFAVLDEKLGVTEFVADRADDVHHESRSGLRPARFQAGERCGRRRTLARAEACET